MQFNFCISLMNAVTAAAYKLKEKKTEKAPYNYSQLILPASAVCYIL